MKQKIQDYWFYYAATFLAIVGLQSIPRFIFEINKPLLIGARLVLLLIFFLVAWFFTVSTHEKFRWSTLSSLFVVEAAASLTLVIMLFLQLYSFWFIYATLVVLAARAFVYSYVVSHRLTHMRALVFGTCAFLLVAGEIILINTRIS